MSSMRMRTRLTALGAVLLGAVAMAGPAQAAAGNTAEQARAPFAAQARTAGLNDSQADELQRRIDAALRATGGEQVGVNKIDLDHKASLILPLPGERQAREVSDAGILGEPCYRGWACLYQYENFEGALVRMYECGKVGNPWWGTGSWQNQQPSNYRMKFYDRSGRLGWTSPGGYSEDRHAPLDWVGYVSAC
ncbi:hypothetical protein ACIBEA_13240 [Streptomyces sp. NPDC051555]|uniref:hypothetical protein n=1 Tax=Streptomyces sp. NPDC051555 TaxID=3365657 RepID=UPI0037B2AD2A